MAEIEYQGRRYSEMLSSEEVALHRAPKAPALGVAAFFVLAFLLIQIFAVIPAMLVHGFFTSVIGGTMSIETHMVWTVLFSDTIVLWMLYHHLGKRHQISLGAVGLQQPLCKLNINVILIMLFLVGIWVVEVAYTHVYELNLQNDLNEVFTIVSSGQTPISFFALLLTIVVIAPVVEEFIFRGYLQTALVQHLGPVAGIALSSVVFATIHFDYEAFPILLLAGIGLGYLYHINKSLWPPMILHGLNNSFASFEMLYL